MGTIFCKSINILHLFMGIVNNFLESILKCFYFKLNFFFETSTKALVLFEDKAYYRHKFVFSVVRNTVKLVYLFTTFVVPRFEFFIWSISIKVIILHKKFVLCHTCNQSVTHVTSILSTPVSI